MNEAARAFGARLRSCRQSALLSQQELADRAGLSVRAISNLESGRTRFPYQDSLSRLADALGLRDPARTEFIGTAHRRLACAPAADATPGNAASPQDTATPGNAASPEIAITDDGRIVPRQLPLPPAAFVGRRLELAVLSHGGAAAILAISGTAGVGKTALAVQWAHQAAEQFPDGQLYVNLRGFGPSAAPVTPAEAIRGFLEALGLPAGQVPRAVPARLGLYRSLLAGQRLLIVLDNARDAAQVRPLLPGSPACRVVVTSRDQLTGLTAIEGARPVTLDVLTDSEALDLLRQRLGPDRVAAAPDAAAQITSACANLPLALCIIAARAAMRPRLPLARIAAELTAQPQLDAFTDGDDPTADLRVSFSWSYRQLPAAAAHAFRLASLHPGPNLSAAAAASLAGISGPQADGLLGKLARSHLLAQDGRCRFAVHDLLRSYAAEQASSSDSEPDRAAAVRRTADHYLASAAAAVRLLKEQRVPPAMPPASPGVTAERFDTRQEALDWLLSEYEVLLRVMSQTAQAGLDVHACQLPMLLIPVFEYRARWPDWAAAGRIALAAASRLDDPRAQATARLLAGQCGNARHRWLQADEHLQDALARFRALADAPGQADSLARLSVTARGLGHYHRAADLAQRARELYEETGDLTGQAGALASIGLASVHLGDPRHGIATLTAALVSCREQGETHGEAMALAGLGLARQHTGNHRSAIAHVRLAVSLLRDTGDYTRQSAALTWLGDACQAAGQHANAAQAWRQALAILSELQHPNADVIRAKLTPPGTAARGCAQWNRRLGQGV